MDKNILELVVKEQRELFDKKNNFLFREIPLNLINNPKIGVISGIRRCGKSVLLKQISNEFENYAYLNFEDERLLNFLTSDFNNLLEIFLKLYGDVKVFFFDEIQNVEAWEKFVRRLFENGNKVFVTGSNAKLLSSELATTLTGRHINYELYPFSFKEFLKFKNFDIQTNYLTSKKAQMLRLFEEYMKFGGFPEVVKSYDIEELKQLYQDTLIKDLIVRFNIRDTKSFRELVLYLISNFTSKISFNNLAKILGFKSVTSVKNYIDFLEETYLLFSLNKFDYSVKKQLINDRKIYSIDTGLVNSVSFQFSKNIGQFLENIVYIELKRRNKDIFYHFKLVECDFLVREGVNVISAIQVSKSLEDPQTKQRELKGILEACKTYNLKTGLILTQDEEGEETIDNIKIQIKPIWRWLLE